MTGTYKYNSETKQMELVSTSIPNIKARVWMPRKVAHSGHRFENLGKTFYSEGEKREYMKKKNIAEAG